MGRQASFKTITHAAKRLGYRLQGKRFAHFLHVGKTGGAAFKGTVAPFTTASPHYVLYLHRHGVTLRDVPPGDRFFFFVRDPVSRYVSGFYSRQRQGRPRFDRPWHAQEAAAFADFETPNELAAALSSPDEDMRRRAETAMKSINHVKDSYWKWFESEAYFLARLPDLLFIGFQNRLTEAFKVLKAELQLPAHLRLPDDDIGSHRSPAGLDKHLDAEAVTNLKQWYRRDYDFVRLCEQIMEAGADE